MMRALALSVALLGCGEKHAARTHQIEIKGMQFVPAQLTVDVGDTVVWTNNDVLPHTVTSGIPAPMAFDSKAINAKAQWSLTVSAAGDYNYVCSFHPTMKATLTVH
jgi:plastocyanin